MLPPLFVLSECYASAPSDPGYTMEDIGDELEDRFWAEEEKQFDRLRCQQDNIFIQNNVNINYPEAAEKGLISNQFYNTGS